MGVKVRGFDGGQVVMAGAHVRGVTAGGAPSAPLGAWDPIGCGAGSMVMVYGPFQCEEVARHRHVPSPVLEIVRTKPDARPYNGTTDWLHYGSILSSVSVLSSVLSGASPMSVPSSERNCVHNRVRGGLSVVDFGVEPYLHTAPFRDGVLAWSGYDADTITTQCVDLVKGWCEYWTTGSNDTRRPLDTLRFVNSGGLPYYETVPNPVRWMPCWHTSLQFASDITKGLRWYAGTRTPEFQRATPGGSVAYAQIFMDEITAGYLTPTHYRIDYTFHVTLRETEWWYDYSSVTTFVCSFTHKFHGFRGDLTTPSTGVTDIDVTNLGIFSEEWTCRVAECDNPTNGARHWGDLFSTTGITTTVDPDTIQTTLASFTSTLTEVGDLPDRLSRVSRALDPGPFGGLVEQRMGDIRLSAFQSTSDAFTALEDGLETNLIEQISQLSGLPDYLPRLSECVRLVKTLAKKDVIGTVAQLTDIVADLRLRYAYAYGPDFDFLMSEIPKIESLVIQLLSTGPTVRVARGKFSWDFPEGEFNVPYSRLETRTKLVLPVVINRDILEYMGVHTIGLTPTPGNFWDLVPFSFVVDWFVDIGRRLREAENIAVLSLTAPSYLVHTFKVVAPVPDQVTEAVLEDMYSSESVFDAARLEWVRFEREISRSVPPPFTGRYDFALPGRPPNWMNAAALAWSLFKI